MPGREKCNLVLVCAVAAALGWPAGVARAVILNSTGLVTASGSDLGQYLGAGTFYGAGYTGTRATVVNIEGGQAWNGHQSLTQMGYMPLLGGAVWSTQRHATGVASVIAGRGNRPLDVGIAHGATLYSGTMASMMFGEMFAFTAQSFGRTYAGAMAGFTPVGSTGGVVRADVINSSWAGGGTWIGTSSFADQMDALVARHGTTVVAAAGNAGPGTNTMNVPATSYNVIAVGSLRSDTPAEITPAFNSPSTFSSRGPVFRQGANQVTFQRAAVSLAAPGENFSVAAYNGPGTVPNWYNFNASGTSYAAPTVAAGAALLTDVGRDRFVRGDDRSAIDGRVIKAVLMNSADKTTGWFNGQNLQNGVVRTDQALDYTVGTGRMNLTKAFGQYAGGGTVGAITAGGVTITGAAVGAARAGVLPTGWNLERVSAENPTDVYSVLAPLVGASTLTATLTWFSEATYQDVTDAATLDALADLSLEVWRVRTGGLTPLLVAQSNADFTSSEHLSFSLPTGGMYEIRVNYLGRDIENATASADTTTAYALAWTSVAIPEPGTVGVLVMLSVGALTRRRR